MLHSKVPTHTPGQGRQREREGSWGGCQLQPEGADGEAVLGLEKCREWEAPKESLGIDKGWKQGGKEEKVLFASVYKHQEFQSIRKLYLVSTARFGNRALQRRLLGEATRNPSHV